MRWRLHAGEMESKSVFKGAKKSRELTRLERVQNTHGDMKQCNEIIVSPFNLP
jgi:hypothetical protein